jgi:nucleotide-binding universal stress UspA family protein
MENTLIPQGTIVVGMDGSSSAGRALDWAIEQAVRERRQLTLAHGVDPAGSVWLDPIGGADQRSLLESQRDDALDMLAKARQYVALKAPNLSVHESVWIADPARMLLELAETAALLVVGSRGRGPVRSLLLGSVGVAVTRNAACPVVVVRPGNPGVVRHGVVVGADGTPDSLATVELAYRLASVHTMPLTILHCAWEWRPNETPEETRLRAVEPLSGLAERFPDVRARVEVVHGDPADLLIEESKRMDLVVVGAHHGTRFAALLHGSVAESVVEHAVSPVVVVPVAVPVAT